jgi:hypothetical protein
MDGFTVLSDHTSGSNSLRTYSATLATTLRESIRRLQGSDQFDAQSLHADLATLQSEASFFGYPACARMTRETRGLIRCIEMSERASNEQRDLLLAAVTVLVNLIEEPCNASLISKVDAACARIADYLSRNTSSSVERTIFQFGTVAPAANVSRTHEVSGHEDLDIYSSDVVDGMEKCSDEESWIVAQLASAAEDLAGRYSDIRPAHKLMSVLRGHRFFQHMDRICIVGLMPQANQLVVVDSCIHDRLRERGIKNRMPKGYSCFVNPAGSLFQMKPGVLRIFADSQTVLESFAKGRKARSAFDRLRCRVWVTKRYLSGYWARPNGSGLSVYEFVSAQPV